MLKVLTSNCMHEYNLLKDFFSENKATLYEYQSTINDLTMLIKESQQVNEFKKEILKAKIQRHTRETKIIGCQSFYKERVDDLISEFEDQNL